MRKIFAISFIIIIVGLSLLSCEKDDICAEGTPTTPSLVVEFFSNENRSVNKTVSNLKYFVEGMDNIIERQNVTEIRVPLRVDAESTKWGFTYSYIPTGSSTEVVNTDYLEFNYTTQQTYVSRACGFKSTFSLNADSQASPNPVLTDAAGESSLWIQDVRIENNNIENENETHISIYF